jgi:hypothetical protein
MQKIPTLFVRDPDDRRYVLPEVTPGSEWVLAGHSLVTRKWDGTCVMLDEHDAWWARREVKPGKTPPPNYTPISTDEVTGKTVGWEPIEQSSFAKYHAEALTHAGLMVPSTYELCGPKINGNPEMLSRHALILHGWAPSSETDDIKAAPRDYEGLRDWLQDRHYEGLVWHHPDGRAAKLKAKDFR